MANANEIEIEVEGRDMKWRIVMANVDGEGEKEVARILIDENFKEEADQLRATVHDTPFGFVAATRTATFGPYRYRESAMEIAETTSYENPDA
jgi:hypothetical protein